MGLLDNFLTLTGHPDPRMQIAAALNPVAAQLGGGPAPGPPPSPGGPPGGGAPGQPPATGAPQAAPGGPAPAPPQPQVLQSTPALSQAYSQLANPPNLVDLMAQAYQRQQTSSDFDKHLGMIVAGFGRPRSRGVAEALMGSQGQDPGPMFSNLLHLQGYTQEQQRYADVLKNAPIYGPMLGMTPEQFTSFAQSQGPEGIAPVIAKIVEAQTGVGATLPEKEYRDAMKTWGTRPEEQDAQGNPLPKPSMVAWIQAEQNKATAGQAQAKDVQTFKDTATTDYNTVNTALTQNEKYVDKLLANEPATLQALTTPWPTTGVMGAWDPAVGPNTKNAAIALNKLRAGLTGDVLKNTKNVRNLREFNTLGQAATGGLDAAGSSQELHDALVDIKNKFLDAHATAEMAAGHKLTGALVGHGNRDLLDRNNPFYNGATEEAAPAGGGGGGGGGPADLRASKNPDGDYEKLPSGAVFIAPDGQQRRKP